MNNFSQTVKSLGLVMCLNNLVSFRILCPLSQTCTTKTDLSIWYNPIFLRYFFNLISRIIETHHQPLRLDSLRKLFIRKNEDQEVLWTVTRGLTVSQKQLRMGWMASWKCSWIWWRLGVCTAFVYYLWNCSKSTVTIKIDWLIDCYYSKTCWWCFRWLAYSALGKCIPGTRFICFKVPLKDVSTHILFVQ